MSNRKLQVQKTEAKAPRRSLQDIHDEMVAKQDPEGSGKRVQITAPKFTTALVSIQGITPFVQHAFSAKARKQMEARQREGGKKGRQKQAPKDFEAIYEAAIHRSEEGWAGVPAGAFRNAIISACRVAGFPMTRAKLSIFIESDGRDREDSTPLVKIHGKPRLHEQFVRNETGVADIRWRPMWDEWRIDLRIRYDAEQFTEEDIGNLLARAGLQVGIGEGRPDSPKSNGQDWGRFEIL